jgi:16S rRNA (guanine527-N7)-methyltransferase
MIEQLKATLETLGMALSDAAWRKLDEYHALLMEHNKVMDLTNVPEEDMPLLHYADSILPLVRTHAFFFGATLIDVGSGAGFPGMVIAIARPDMKVTLMDSLQKRCHFLTTVKESLILSNVNVVHARAEEAARAEHRERYDIAAARAVAPMNVLCEYLLPFVKLGGSAMCWKGPAILKELADAEQAVQLLGGEMGELVNLNLPGREHYVQLLHKKIHTPGAYPRKAGTPSKKPLGQKTIRSV